MKEGRAMITNHEVERQLKAIGFRPGGWGRAEIKELEQVIEPGETIMYCVNGHYENGFALLCVTDHRVLLIDKKPLYLTLEDINYDMISEIDFDARLFDSSVKIHTISKKMRFTCLSTVQLRQATAYIQRRILEFRRQSILAQQIAKPQAGGSEPNVSEIEHRITNEHIKTPFAMRRRLPRFYGN